MAISDRLQLIQNSLIGGSVISILARQVIRRKLLQAAAAFDLKKKGLAGQANPPAIFVAGVPVTSRLQEAYTMQSDATQHSVESGAVLTDHVILQPVKVDLSFEVSNWEPGRSEYALDLLTELWQKRIPLDLLTEHKKLESMVLTSLQADNSAPVWRRLSFRATFQQIKFIELQSYSFPEEKVRHAENTGGPDNSKSIESPKDRGQRNPVEKESSFLYRITS